MRPCRPRNERQWREWRKRGRKNSSARRIAVDICRRHRAEERELFVHPLAGIQHHGNLFAPTRVTEKHEFLQSDDTGS